MPVTFTNNIPFSASKLRLLRIKRTLYLASFLALGTFGTKTHEYRKHCIKKAIDATHSIVSNSTGYDHYTEKTMFDHLEEQYHNLYCDGISISQGLLEYAPSYYRAE